MLSSQLGLYLKKQNTNINWTIKVFCFLLLLGISSSVNAQSSPPPFPENYGDKSVTWPGWTDVGYRRYLNPDDPASARYIGVLADEEESVSFELAAEVALEFVDANVVEQSPIKMMDTANEILPETIAFTMGTSKLGGQKAIYFMHMERRADDGLIAIWFFEAPEATFRDWGGAAAMLISFGNYDNPAIRNQSLLDEVGNASFEEQMAFYEKIYTLNIQDIMMGIIAVQSGTFSILQDLNLKLLFDGEISAPFGSE